MWARSDIKRPRIKTGHIVHSAVGFGVPSSPRVLRGGEDISKDIQYPRSNKKDILKHTLPQHGR